MLILLIEYIGSPIWSNNKCGEVDKFDNAAQSLLNMICDACFFMLPWRIGVNLDMFPKSWLFGSFDSMGGFVDIVPIHLNFIRDVWILGDMILV